MNTRKWLVLAAALGMMAATGSYLANVHMKLGTPGVKVGPGILRDEAGQVVARQRVILPDRVLEFAGADLPVMRIELEQLPKDTTFGRKIYVGTNQFKVQTSVVLMGSDRTSIHDPHYCLDAGGWHIETTDRVQLPMDPPHPPVSALKITTAPRATLDEFKLPTRVVGIYVYWFVSADRLTADQGTRMWSLARTMVETGVLERWAYISYFTTCNPGEEKATFAQLERFIRASAPEFQMVADQSSAGQSPVVTR